MNKRLAQIVTIIAGVVYAAFLQFYVGMTETRDYLICLGIFVVVFGSILGIISRICREHSIKEGDQQLIIMAIVPWLCIGFAPLFKYLWPMKNVFLILILLVLGWTFFLYPAGWLWQQWRLRNRCSAVTTAHVVDNEASVVPEEGRDFEDTTPNTYHPIFSFTVHGKTYRVTGNDGKSEPIPLGEVVAIQYDPTDVTYWMVEPEKMSAFTYIVVGSSIVVSVILLGISVYLMI